MGRLLVLEGQGAQPVLGDLPDLSSRLGPRGLQYPDRLCRPCLPSHRRTRLVRPALPALQNIPRAPER
jgi:hypothetical protein